MKWKHPWKRKTRSLRRSTPLSGRRTTVRPSRSFGGSEMPLDEMFDGLDLDVQPMDFVDPLTGMSDADLMDEADENEDYA